MKTRTRVSHAALLLFVIAAHAHAASDEGTVTGAVTDSSGKPVGNASVAFRTPAVQPLASAKTDADGHFAIASRDAGNLRACRYRTRIRQRQQHRDNERGHG